MASRRESTRYSLQNDGSDDEDYALAAMGISDGRRPVDMPDESATPASRISQTHERRVSNVHPFRERLSGAPIPPPRPSSTTKPRYDFALRYDGGGHLAGRNSTVASTSNALPSRTSSISTDVPIRAESPYQGPMQATNPYTMYHQNIVPESEEEPVVPSVPVGFSGQGNQYQRRIGPEGEEIADIIGPHGHTEQLPPYTQYPEEAFARKTRPMVQVPEAASGAGGIGLATRDPEFSSREDLNTPDSRVSSGSLTLADSGPQSTTPVAAISEKPPLKTWQKFLKKKVCGIIPMWAIILAAIVVIMFGIVLGSVLAALKPKHPPGKHNHNVTGNGYGNSQGTVYTTLTTTFDATPLSTVPSGISTLPTGVYGLPISTPSTAQQSCIKDTSQNVAWSCQIPMDIEYQVEVDSIQGAQPLSSNEITLTYENGSIDFFPYGAQAPTFSQAQVLGLSIDSQDPERGPAWFFQMPYNKVVILPQNALAAPIDEGSGNNKRQSDYNAPTPEAFMQRKGVAQVGDMPWFCYWNGTLLETFIYVNQTSSSGRSATTTSTSPSTATSMGGYRSTAGSGSQSTQATSAPSSDYGDPDWVTNYPKVVKVQERRIPGGDAGNQAIPPYCVQHKINGDYTASPALNSSNQPITIYLNETEPSTVYPISARNVPNLFDLLEQRDRDLRGRDSSTSCGCVWVST